MDAKTPLFQTTAALSRTLLAVSISFAVATSGAQTAYAVEEAPSNESGMNDYIAGEQILVESGADRDDQIEMILGSSEYETIEDDPTALCATGTPDQAARETDESVPYLAISGGIAACAVAGIAIRRKIGR